MDSVVLYIILDLNFKNPSVAQNNCLQVTKFINSPLLQFNWRPLVHHKLYIHKCKQLSNNMLIRQVPSKRFLENPDINEDPSALQIKPCIALHLISYPYLGSILKPKDYQEMFFLLGFCHFKVKKFSEH